MWYAFAALVFTSFIYFFGNAMWNPSTGAITGMPDAILAWFYGHGIVGLFLTPLAVAVAYYVIPFVEPGPPLQPRPLARRFLVDPHVLPAHRHPSSPADPGAHVAEDRRHHRQRRHAHPRSDRARQPVADHEGAPGNAFTPTSGASSSSPAWCGTSGLPPGAAPVPAPVQRLTHLTNWVVAHSHIAVLGFSGFIGLGAIYFTLPRITGRPLYSQAGRHPVLARSSSGLRVFSPSLPFAGLIQGTGWLNGQIVYVVLPQIYLYFVLRAALGMMIIGGAVIGFYNIVRSLYGARRARNPPMDMNLRLILGGSLMILAAILCVAVILPWATSTEKPSDILRLRTPWRKRAGRSTSPTAARTATPSSSATSTGIGAERIAQIGDYVRDQPHLLGSERTGPDLSQEGGEHPDDWHLGPFHQPPAHAPRVDHARL